MEVEDLDRKLSAGLAEAIGHQLAGESEAALRALEELEGIARSTPHPQLAHILILKAGFLRELGAHESRSTLDEAEAVCNNLPVAFPTLWMEQSIGIAFPALWMEQGIVARRAGDLKKAESALNTARKFVQDSPFELVMMSDILANLSSVYSDQGRQEDAQTALLKAIQYDRRTNDPRALASNLNMIGLLYLNVGDPKTARIYLRQSKRTAEEAGLAKELADAKQNLAIVSDHEGKTEEAKAGFVTALKEAEEAGRQLDVASAKNSLGGLAIKEGKFEEARRLITEALEIHSTLGMKEFCVNGLLNLTQNELLLGSPLRALNHAKDALAMAEKHVLMHVLWIAHYFVATSKIAVWRQHAPMEAELDKVLTHYAKAADAIEMLRIGIGRPEERERLLVGKEEAYAQAMLLAVMVRRGTTAWTFAERARGRSFSILSEPAASTIRPSNIHSEFAGLS